MVVESSANNSFIPELDWPKWKPSKDCSHNINNTKTKVEKQILVEKDLKFQNPIILQDNIIPEDNSDLDIINNIKASLQDYSEHTSINWVKVWNYKYVYNFLKKLNKDNKVIFWNWLSKNISWTFINEDLFWFVPETKNFIWSKNRIIIKKYGRKKIMLVYLDWVLEIATYVSPWKTSTKTPRYFIKIPWITDKYHASSNKEYKWAVMPYWVLVNGEIWIWLHGSWDIVDWKPRSHWCIRVPLFYQKRLYELVKSWVNFTIDTTKIY
jgi:hypothetical protein